VALLKFAGRWEVFLLKRRALMAVGGVLLLAGSGICTLAEGSPGLPKIGSRLPDLIQEARMRNAPVDVKAPRGGWVIYVFSPGSSSCSKNAGSVEQLARSLPPDWVLLSVATEAQGVAEFVDRHRVTVPVLTQVPEKVLGQYRITGTPRTYILEESWQLVEILEGAFQGQVARRLETRFKVKLPAPAAPAQSSTPPRSKPGSASLCLDMRQGRYSHGAKADVLGFTFRCGAGGVWVPAT
jgi:hypothetical protein